MDLEKSQKDLIAHLLKYSVKKGDFTLKSGIKSDWFCDSKQTACRPEGISIIADLILAKMPADTTAIGGLTAGADPIAFGVAAIAATRFKDGTEPRRLNAFSIRKESKEHGVEGRLAGVLEKGDKALIVEDTVTRGTSALQAAEAVLELGAEPTMIISLVDRGGTLVSLLAEWGKEHSLDLKYEALATAADLGFKG